MKLLGICLIGFVGICFARDQSIRASGIVQCCSKKNVPSVHHLPDFIPHPPRPISHGQQQQTQQTQHSSLDDYEKNKDDCVNGKWTKGGKGTKGGDCDDTKGSKQVQQQQQQSQHEDFQVPKGQWVQSGRDKRGIKEVCEGPLRAEVKLIDHSMILSDKTLQTVQLEKGETQYLINWNGDRMFTVKAQINIEGECQDGTRFDEEFDWTNEIEIRQDVTINSK